MSKVLVTALAVIASSLAAAVSGSSFAGNCDEPVTDWRPREVLRSILEAGGWHVLAITVRDGCYVAVMSDDKGRESDARFDPKTLEMVGDNED